MKRMISMLAMGVLLAGCGSSKHANQTQDAMEAAAAAEEAEAETTEEAPAEEPTDGPVVFHFEILKDGAVLSNPKITSQPGSPMQISTDEVEFNLSFEHAEGGAKLYGDWTGGEIAATKGPFGTRVSLVVDPERGLELVVTARKHKPEPAAPPSE